VKRALKIASWTIGSLLIVVLAVATFLMATEAGARLVLRLLPASIQVASVDGRLAGPLVVHGVRLETATLSVGVERAELRWRPGRLLSGALAIDRLQADGVSVTTLRSPEEPPPPDTGPFELPSELGTPVALELDELVVNDVEYRSAPAAEPLVVEAIGASLAATGTTFTLERLQVSAPLFDVDAEAELTARGDYPLAARVDATLRPEGLAPVRSTTRVDGSLQSMRVRETVAEPYNLEAEARIADPFETLRLEARARLSGVDPAAVKTGLPEASLSAEVAARGTPSDLALQATLDGVHQAHRVNAELEAELEDDRLSIRTLSARLPGHESRLDGSGSVRLAGDFPTDASLTWQDLKWPLGDDPDYRSASGRVSVTGSLDDYRVSVKADMTLPGDVPLQAALSGEGSRERLDAELQVDMLEGRIDGSAAVAWRPTLEASVELDGDDVDPAALSREWPGRIDFALRAHADVADGKTRARLETLTASGELRGQPLEVEGEGAFDAGDFVVDRLQAELGATRLTAHGRYADVADFEWQLVSDDLGELLPSASGKVTSEGTLSGSPPQVLVDATLRGSALGYQDNRVAALELTADVDLTDRETSTIDLRIEGLESAALTGKRIELAVDGRPSAHRASLTAETNRGRAELELEGRLRDPWGEKPAWLYRLTDATVAYPELRPWRLDTPAEGTVSGAEVSARRHCWTSGPAKLCLAGRRTPERVRAAFSLDALAFDYFASLLPAGLELEGELGGRGEVVQPTGGVLRADVALETSDGRLALTAGPADDGDSGQSEQTLLVLEPSRLSLTLDEDTAKASADLEFEEGHVDLQAELAASAAPLMQRPLDGRLEVDVPDIAFIAPFVPQVEELQGSVGGALSFAGTPERPRLSGRIGLDDGALVSPAAGTRVSDLAVALEGRGDAAIGLDASARSGGGHLQMAGELGLGKTPANATIEVTGEDFQLLGNEEARVYISPDLQVEAGADAVRITGEVGIPRADITPQEPPESAVAPSEDVVVLSPDSEHEANAVQDPAGRPVHAEVRIVLGDEVRFEGFGLQARFEGETTLIQEPDQPTLATGEITIAEGEYRAYGQGLVIESGKILFAGGPVTEPGLDVRAVRRPQEGILVGSQVRGTLEEPEFTLFSEPPMSQQEQLSYLVLGRSLQEAPAGESSALAQASLAMGVKGGSFLAENLGEDLGLDEFSIQSGSGEAGAASDPADAALVVGKYLSPRLYLSYGIGLFDPVSVLTMQYEINRRLNLKTESSSESTGADLVYSFERGN